MEHTSLKEKNEQTKGNRPKIHLISKTPEGSQGPAYAEFISECASNIWWSPRMKLQSTQWLALNVPDIKQPHIKAVNGIIQAALGTPFTANGRATNQNSKKQPLKAVVL